MQHTERSYAGVLWRVAAMAIGMCVFASLASAQSWQLVKIDSVPAATAAIDIDSQGRPHVLYCDTRYDSVTRAYTFGYTYAMWDGTAWQKHAFSDVSASEGQVSLELDSQDRPHMAFYVYNKGAANPGTVRYATTDVQGQWRVENAFAGGAGYGCYPSLALDSHDRPCISHRGNYTYFDGLQWQTQAAPVGDFTDLKLDILDQPNITSVTTIYARPQYAIRHAGAWLVTDIIPPSVESSGGTSLELDSFGNAHVAWWRTETCLPVLSVQTPQGWQTTEPAEQPHLRSRYCDDVSLELDASGKACMAYTWFIDDSQRAARYGVWDGQTWNLQTIADGLNVLGPDSFTLDSLGRPHVLLCRYTSSGEGEIYYAYLPEPGTLSLLAVGGLATLRRRVRR